MKLQCLSALAFFLPVMSCAAQKDAKEAKDVKSHATETAMPATQQPKAADLFSKEYARLIAIGAHELYGFETECRAKMALAHHKAAEAVAVLKPSVNPEHRIKKLAEEFTNECNAHFDRLKIAPLDYRNWLEKRHALCRKVQEAKKHAMSKKEDCFYIRVLVGQDLHQLRAYSHQGNTTVLTNRIAERVYPLDSAATILQNFVISELPAPIQLVVYRASNQQVLDLDKSIEENGLKLGDQIFIHKVPDVVA